MAESCSPRWGQAEPSRVLQVLHVWLACLITLPVAGDKAVAAAVSVDSGAEAWGRMIAVGAADGFVSAAELQAKNAECLMTGQGGAAVLYNASGHFVTVLEDAFQPQVAGRAVSLGSRQVASLAGSLQALIELEGHIASACFSRELLLDLRKASDALLLLRAQNGRLMLQRTDVHDDLVTASKDFAHEEFASFGRDLGGLWRRALRDAVSSTKQKKEEAVPAMPGPKRPTSSDLLEVTSALLRSFFGHRSDGRAIFLWEHPVLFDHCIGKMSPTLPALEELWDSIGEVLLQVAPSEKLWSFSTPDEQVTTREVQQLAQLGRILQELPMILQDCGLQGNAQKMFLQSVTVFRSPPDKILNAAASSLFVLEQHWTASAWQEAGSKLGLLMQDMLLDTFPETVHFDGRLRPLTAQSPNQGATTHVIFLCLVAGLAVPVTGLAAARGWNVPRIVRAMFEIRQVRCDTCEEGRRGQAVEEIQIEVNRIRRLEMSGLLEEEETVEDFHESFADPRRA